MRQPLTPRARLLISVVLVAHALLALACAPATALPSTGEPRWACPSVTPVPTRVKESRPLPTTTPGVDPGTEDTYFEPWEQEYGRPIMTPTPYARTSTTHLLGQRVEVWPVHALVTARYGAMVGGKQLHIVRITWINHGAEPLPMDYVTRVRIRGVRSPNGQMVLTDAGMTTEARQAAGLPELPDTIPVGESTVEVPILAEPGATETVAVIFLMSSSGVPQQTPGAPAGTAPAPTPTPTASSNTDLRNGGRLPLVTVTWNKGVASPPCDHPGVVTNWGDGPTVADSVAAPAGADRVVQVALNQVGKRYVWGAKGPNQFDCSGLVQWAYAQIGIRIPTGTANQWPGLPVVTLAQAKPGDLVFFDTLGAGRITHVGMLAGDLNNDGTWDMVHAASPEYGVRIDYSVFERPYYAKMFRGIRTVRR